MPRPRLAMRKVREILRLADEGLPLRQIGATLGVPFTTVGDHLRRAARAGVAWPLPDELDDVALEALLFPRGPAPEPNRPLPDGSRVHRELRRPGVTLMLLWHEYREEQPDGYTYSQFCLHYRAFQRRLDLPMRQEHRAGERLFVDFPGQRLPIYDRRSGEVRLEAELWTGPAVMALNRRRPVTTGSAKRVTSVFAAVVGSSSGPSLTGQPGMPSPRTPLGQRRPNAAARTTLSEAEGPAPNGMSIADEKLRRNPAPRLSGWR